MRVLVTGSTGFIGSATVTKLAERGHSVVAYSRSEKPRRGLGKIEHIKGDIFDTPSLLKAIKTCDAVIHTVGLNNVRIAQDDPEMSFELNIRSLQNVLETMRNIGVRRLILPSSSLVYGQAKRLPIKEDVLPNPIDTYGFHKYIAEKIAETYSCNYAICVNIMRLFNVYGVGGSGILPALAEKAARNETFKLYGKKQKRDFIYISDIADVFVRILEIEHGSDTYNVGTGIGRSIEDIVNLAKECLPALRVESATGSETLYDSVADSTRIKNATDFNPDTSDDKIRQVIQELRKRTQN